MLVLALLVCAPARAVQCDPAHIAILTGHGAARFSVEIADNPAKRARGLMFRPELAGDAGMLFVFDPPQQVDFWMRNTMIPLDMVFIDDTGRVESVATRRDTYSDRISSSKGKVRAVLEINAGRAAKLGIGPGDQAIHPAFAAAPAAAHCGP